MLVSYQKKKKKGLLVTGKVKKWLVSNWKSNKKWLVSNWKSNKKWLVSYQKSKKKKAC